MPKVHPGQQDEWPLEGLIVNGRLVKEEVSNVGWPEQVFNRTKIDWMMAGLGQWPNTTYRSLQRRSRKETPAFLHPL
jgi:hypothetical protein